MAAWSVLSMLPDADVIGFDLGIAYEDPLGHRGASHSLIFAAAVGAIVGLVATRFGLPRLRAWLIATAVLASHGLLDTLTDGGLGCALFWPFDLTRYFAPWRPIPVSPIGLAFLSPYGAFVSATELILFSPLLFLGLRRSGIKTTRRRVKQLVLLTLWLVLVWLIGSTDPLRQAGVQLGMKSRDVLQQLGPPPIAIWEHSRSRGGGWFHASNALFWHGRVRERMQRWSRVEWS
jgi:inner membrane protein